ncbi:hypothetical protein PFISCL1PPCAC_23445, partial [Pristionchus fissidentatus]
LLTVMDHRLVLVLLSLTTVSLAASASSWNDNNRYRDYDYGSRYDDAPRGRDTKRDDYAAQIANGNGGSHTYQSRPKCDELCLNPCGSTTVYLEEGSLPMYTCDKLKPPKMKKILHRSVLIQYSPPPVVHVLVLPSLYQYSFLIQLGSPFFQTLKGSSFYVTLCVLGAIVVVVVVIVTCCFCCSYCCRNPSSAESSRGSSKQALAHNEDGEFKEYLNGNGNGMSNGHHHDDIGAMKREREREFARRPRPVPQIV